MGSATVMACSTELNLLQMFVMSPSGAVMTDESVCLDAPERDHATLQPKVRIMACSGLGRQRWSYNDQASSRPSVQNYSTNLNVVTGVHTD